MLALALGWFMINTQCAITVCCLIYVGVHVDDGGGTKALHGQKRLKPGRPHAVLIMH